MSDSPPDLSRAVHRWGRALGFDQVGIADLDLEEHEIHLLDWLARGWHGEMGYMQRHGVRRSRPKELVPGTQRVISVRLNYLPHGLDRAEQALADPVRGYVSRYALGRDYHKVLRSRLRRLVRRIEEVAGPFGYRVFTDSAPVLEKGLAERAGLGWIGKHTNLLAKDAGSWFFLGEIYTDLPLTPDPPTREEHCGSCRACIDICPTQAIVAPYQLDARRCISYLTIELKGPIPAPLRPLIGNRVYGCDDCQLVCPWNRYAQLTAVEDFRPRAALERSSLVEMMAWEEEDFLRHTEGTAMRRIGHLQWLRNVAVALGNAPRNEAVVASLRARAGHPSELVREHVAWALERHA